MVINYNKTNWKDLEVLTVLYHVELAYKNDGFHNGMMFGAEPYTIEVDGEVCGFFSISDSWEKNGKMLTSFFIVPGKRRFSDIIFGEIVEKFDIAQCLVPSNDSHLVALAFELMKRKGTTFEMQAYNFIFGSPEREPEFSEEELFEVQPDEYEELNKLTEGQWDGCFESGDVSFYKICRDGETLGYGAIGKMLYNDKYVDIGNFTLPRHRRKGVGRSMIILLSRKAIADGCTPTVGCWYGNKESLPTLRSSGYSPENRIFYIKFK